MLSPPRRDPNIIALPSGDSMALVFLHSIYKEWDLSTIFKLIIRLQKWASVATDDTKPVEIRFGVYVGPVEFITDINGKTKYEIYVEGLNYIHSNTSNVAFN